MITKKDFLYSCIFTSGIVLSGLISLICQYILTLNLNSETLVEIILFSSFISIFSIPGQIIYYVYLLKAKELKKIHNLDFNYELLLIIVISFVIIFINFFYFSIFNEIFITLIFIFTVIISLIQQKYLGWLLGTSNYFSYVSITIFTSVLKLIFILSIFKLNLNVNYLYISFYITTLISYLFTYYIFNRKIKSIYKIHLLSNFKYLFEKVKIPISSTIGNIFIYQIDILMISLVTDKNIAAEYIKLVTITKIPLYLNGTFSLGLLPSINSDYSYSNFRFNCYSFLLALLIVIPFFLLLLLVKYYFPNNINIDLNLLLISLFLLIPVIMVQHWEYFALSCNKIFAFFHIIFFLPVLLLLIYISGDNIYFLLFSVFFYWALILIIAFYKTDTYS